MAALNIHDRIWALSFVCSVLVVLIHCHSMSPWFAGEPGIGACEATVAFFGTYTFARIAVPIFFVLTGFFLAKHYPEQGWWKSALKKRLFSLYVPFVIWNALNAAIGCAAGESVDAVAIFGWNPYVRLGCMQFWYLQSVFIYLLLSPVILAALRSRAGAALLIAGLAAGWLCTFWYYLPLPLALGNYMWMAVGSWAGMNKDAVKTLFVHLPSKVPMSLLLVFIACIVAKVMLGLLRCRVAFDIIDKAVVLSGVAAAFFNLRLLDPVARRFKNLLPLSFFVFAAHTLVLSAVIRTGMAIGLAGMWLYLFKAVFAVVLTICLGVAFRRFVPRIFLVLTGGRG